MESLPLATTTPKTALVTWFSQTGHTERLGRLMAWKLEQAGLTVTKGDHRDLLPSQRANHDLIIVGAPVFYYDAPITFKVWLEQFPAIPGVGVGAYSTFGGPGHNQHNTACNLLNLLAAKGGVPLGMATFGNMSTFAPTWSMGRVKRILKYSHLPNTESFQRTKSFAAAVLDRARQGGPPVAVVHQRSFSPLTRIDTVGVTKRLVARQHRFIPNRCIHCGLCMRKCPTGAISIAKQEVHRPACVLCYGCVNVCPAGAFHMTFMRRPVIGFFDFLKEQQVTIHEPPELRG